MASDTLGPPEGDDGASGESRRAVTAVPGPPSVTVYWRPGCASCARLLAGLARLGVERTEVDIWRDPVAAAAVRRVARGNETVPSVVVGGRALVNPSLDQVLTAVGRSPETPGGRPRRDGVRGAVVAVAILGSFALEASGHPGLSWAYDGVVVLLTAARALGRRWRRERRPRTS